MVQSAENGEYFDASGTVNPALNRRILAQG
jgi:hypothetical protein